MRMWRLLGALCLPLGRAAWPDLPSLINDVDLETYFSVLHPVLQATKLSYTATYGSYRKAEDVNATLAGGWHRLKQLDVDPANGGFHGLVFFNPDQHRAIVAFRGTDLNSSTASGRADSCADKLLWENATYEDLPTECHEFSPSTLDYYTAADRLARQAMATMPADTQPLFVGHSLGAGLAVLVAAAHEREQLWHPAVLSLSAPAFADPLKRRVGRDPRDLDRRKFAIICNAFDPVCHKAAPNGTVEGAVVCRFTPDESKECQECYAGEVQACNECFEQTHVLKHYLVDLNGSARVPPAYRPSCLVQQPLLIV